MIIDRIDEEFLLFALRPDGRWEVPRKGSIQYGLAGAWLAELLVDGYIKIEEKKVLPRGHSDAGEKTLDWALSQLRDARPKKFDKWVYRLGKDADKHRHTVMKRLEGRGHILIERTNGHVRYPQHNPAKFAQMRDHLKGVLYGQRPADDSTIALIAILDGAGLMPHAFGAPITKQERGLLDRLVARDHRIRDLHNAVKQTKGWSLSQLF
ncbi:MAG: GPP34 family phosphoprotein [bacterium]